MTVIRRGLLKVLAATGRIEILDYLQGTPQGGATISGLSRALSLSVGTTWNAVQGLARLGLVSLVRLGSTQWVAPNERSPAWPRVEVLLGMDLPSPHELAYEHFARLVRRQLPAVRMRLFGSVARGEQRPESDVDVEVAFGGTPYSRERVQGVCDRASVATLDRSGIQVTAVVGRAGLEVSA